MVANSDLTVAYVANFSGYNSGDQNPGTVSVINLTNDTVVDTIAVGGGPVGLRLDALDDEFYVANSDGTISTVHVTYGSR